MSKIDTWLLAQELSRADNGATASALTFAFPPDCAELRGDVHFRFFLHRTKRGTPAPDDDSDELLAEVRMLSSSLSIFSAVPAFSPAAQPQIWIHSAFMGGVIPALHVPGVELQRKDIDLRLKSLPVPEDIRMRFIFKPSAAPVPAPALAGPPPVPAYTPPPQLLPEPEPEPEVQSLEAPVAVAEPQEQEYFVHLDGGTLLRLACCWDRADLL